MNRCYKRFIGFVLRKGIRKGAWSRYRLNREVDSAEKLLR
jgi:hypothetical protein